MSEPSSSRGTGVPPVIRAVIFDLDGVLVSTDALHLAAWRAMAARWGFAFPEEIADQLRGVSRTESLELILAAADRADDFDAADRERLAAWKNETYRAQLRSLSPADALPGAARLLAELRARGVKLAVGSSSRNARPILDRLGFTPRFDAIVDGNDLTRGKPDPQVFLLAAERLGLPPAACIVIEDAASGVQAALAAGCAVVAIGSAARAPGAERAVLRTKDLSEVTADLVCANR